MAQPTHKYVTRVFSVAAVAAGALACASQSSNTGLSAPAAGEKPAEKPNGWATSHGRPSEAIVAPASIGSAPTQPVVLGYFTNWAHERKGECAFQTSDVDASLFSHINYAFAQIEVFDGDERVKAAEALTPTSVFEIAPTSAEDEARLYAEVNALKQKNPQLKTMLSVGGWAFNDEATAWIFTSMVENAERRGHFILDAIAYARQHKFDGIDIDWEFPGAEERGGRASDTENFTAFLQEFRAQMHAEASETGEDELLLTIASPAGEYFYKHQQLDKIHEPLNWINIMTYDYHGAWEQVTGANAPLSGDGPTISRTVASYRAAGVPPEKMVLGLATYARTWGEVSEPKLGASTGAAAGPDGPCGPESLTSAQVQNWIKEGRFVGAWDDASQTPFAYSEKEKALVTYDDARSYATKLQFIQSQGLAGAMFWAIDLDDFHAGYPLIRQVKETLSVTPTEQLAATAQ